MATTSKARAVGLNHIALEVGDIEEALAFYGRLFEFTLRGKSEQAVRSVSCPSEGPQAAR
jgi:predicted enzyme related to lactoylglutathione lyase